MVTTTEMRRINKLKQELHNLIGELVDGVNFSATNEDGVVVLCVLPSLLDQLRETITTKVTTSGRSAMKSRPPLCIPAMDLYQQIEKEWGRPPEAYIRYALTPTEWVRLESLIIMVARLTTLIHEVRDVLDPPRLWQLRDGAGRPAACPVCARSFVEGVDGGGQRVRRPTLALSRTECRCLHCGHVWPASQFQFLARVLDG